MSDLPIAAKKAIRLNGLLIRLPQAELGHLYSSVKPFRTNVPQEYRAAIEDRVEQFVAGMSVVYLFAVFEEYLPHHDWASTFEAPDIQRLTALRHIRHSAAHGLDDLDSEARDHGETIPSRPMLGRARGHRDEFEAIARSSSNAAQSQLWVEDWDDEHIRLVPSIGIHLCGYMAHVVQYCIPRLVQQG